LDPRAGELIITAEAFNKGGRQGFKPVEKLRWIGMPENQGLIGRTCFGGSFPTRATAWKK